VTYIHEGITAPKRERWKHGHGQVLRRIMEIYPAKSKPPSEADKARWSRLYRERIHEDDLVDECIEFCFHADLRALLDDRFDKNKIRTRQAERASRKAEIKAKAKHLAPKLKEMVLLDWMMPNGKPLGQCTGEECKHFSGALKRLAKVIPPNRTVASVLTEKEVRKLLV